ncbi:MAG: efflux RND transporter periplasmic adaptor subunit [Bacteroidota bacterium]
MKNITIIIATVVLAGFLAACGGSGSAEEKKAQLEQLKTQQAEITAQIATLQDEILAMGDSLPKEEDRSKVIALTAVTKQNFIHAIDVQGRVDGDENITYSAKVPSVVTKINVKVGQHVSKGTILAELDTKMSKAQLEALKKQYELVKLLYEKRKELWDQKVGSEIEFLQAKNQKEGLEKQMDAAKEGLDMYYIKADFNGTVDEVSIKTGQNVAPGIPCVTVVNPDALKVKADLSEAYSNLVKTGDAASITFPDIQKTISAKVSYSSKTINPMTRTFNVEVNLPNDNDLHPNMVAELKVIDYKNAAAIVVPINAIQQIDGEDIIFVAVKQGDKLIAKKTTVKVGKQYNGLSEILSGLNEGDNVISIGFQDLTDGQVVKL